MGNVKMTDVARAAGVSLTTVGRALYGGYVSEDKRKRIEQVAHELGYIPNKAARGLKSNKSELIGHLLQYNANQLYVKIAGGIEHSALKRGLSVIASTMYTHDDGEPLLEDFRGRGVDGIIITSNGSIGRDTVARLVTLGIPVVMVERSAGVPGTDSVLINDAGGAHAAVSSLMQVGRRSIAFIGCKDIGSYVEVDRRKGYEQALSDGGLAVDRRLTVYTDSYGHGEGYRAMKAILDSGAQPDGVFCTSDILAAGAMQLLYQRRIRIPDDISIVGYDDTISTLLSPRISSVALDISKIGECAVDMLTTRREEPGREDRTVYIDTIFMDRHS